jgi:hypothetical protein
MDVMLGISVLQADWQEAAWRCAPRTAELHRQYGARFGCAKLHVSGARRKPGVPNRRTTVVRDTLVCHEARDAAD